MKRSYIRVLCGILLLGIAMGIMAGVILAMPEEEDLSLWAKVTFQTGGSQELCLFNREGELLKCLHTKETGECTTELLEEGEYYGVCRDGLVRFELTEQGLQNVHGSAHVTDKFSLSFFQAKRSGEIMIIGEARQEWYEYELQSGPYSCKKVIRCTPGESMICEIKNLPYGDYTLLENGRRLCRVELTEEKPYVELSLP